jgi:predicted O-linked N-acetylglucosamine transferase (SPINDLY family)
MLDTIHHSAMTTACDAMAAGLPVLTLRGTAMASRAGESLARAAGVPELVAPDQAMFVEKAVSLASEPAELARLRSVLLARTGPLFDTASRVRELETALLEMLQGTEVRH